MYILDLTHTFSAAHQLTNAYDTKCNDSIHGHNWRTRVVVEVDDLVNNMVIDFTKIKDIINKLDHKNLNDILDFEPTAENLSKYLYHKIRVELGRNSKVTVTIWEGEKASITYFE
ncbi:MAG: 6-carboxytetrahydropterin synthase [Candidatus Lokiarchaeota archaeon]|nr:6-carboxytetrahydropterin synthase [Candidatus Lokiarchaeota archaeon]